MHRSPESTMNQATDVREDGQLDLRPAPIEQEADSHKDVLEIRLNAAEEIFDFMGLFLNQQADNGVTSRLFDQDAFAQRWMNEMGFRDAVEMAFSGFDARTIEKFFLEYKVESAFAKLVGKIVVNNRIGKKKERAKRLKQTGKKLEQMIGRE